ncbi:diaminopimelate epimerase [Coxiella endosymbiont of Amblyomma americanum]|uniref:diaminopimelate epimerase n=1 Tax=Coxiella endosymbiont of Amblyomma americanum TaxID=325775 RepID=UPI00057CEFC6|nr:diaminopimelate epimerase [Coxiella endosymbiont of Amblyomma americanum]AJC50369.1 diaminopimelate epimerase [Coxiella endosymbiont of Amblyomma americanum]AUJ58713.1 diaminopimelate epimerase [Coxiella-like endosymbiont of Amblyomma americanum]
MKIRFTKMHGLGNDFVVIDATKQPFKMTTSQVQQMADRRLGVGFDQLLVIEPHQNCTADFHMRIFNANGKEANHCGNGARCIAYYIYSHKLIKRNASLRISTLKDILELEMQSNNKISVSMGVPRFNSANIPFITYRTNNFYNLEIDNKKVRFNIVSIGNLHAIILVDTINIRLVNKLGSRLSSHRCFPEGINVGFMQIVSTRNIRLYVYERGVGRTPACGSGACAAVAIGRCLGLLKERVIVNQPGGSLVINWQGPSYQIIMTGPATIVFHGEWLG